MEGTLDEAAARAGGVTLEEPGYEDYFGFNALERWNFPDGKQYIEFRVMNEGQKSKFQTKTQRDLVLERVSGNARMKVDQAQERHALLTTSVVGWKVVRKTLQGSFEDVPYSDRAFNEWLEGADPKIIESLEKAIRKANPWLLAEMTVEDIDREIENLKEMREVAVKREAGE